MQDAAKRYAVDPLLIRSVIHAESNFNPLAISPKGAQGLMQLIPSTALRFGASDAMDPKQNIEAGVRYLKYLQQRFPEDLTLTIAAYNAGEGAVSRYKTVPPYRETRGYVQKVSREYQNGLAPGVPAKTELIPAVSAGALPAETASVIGVNPSGVNDDPPVRHLQQVTDAEGRLYLRTR